MRGPTIAIIAAIGSALLVPAVPLAEDSPSPPTATIEAPATSVKAGKSVKLDSSDSRAGTGAIVGHVWDLDGNGSFETDTGADPTVEATPKIAGPLTVHVRVVDDRGLNDDADLDLTVTAPVAMEAADGVASATAGGATPDGPQPAAPSGDGGKSAGDGGAASGGDAPSPGAGESAGPGSGAQQDAQSPAEATDRAPAVHPISTARMSAAPSLVPRAALASGRAANRATQPVADVRAAASTGVTIKDFKFGPSSSSVNVGDTITWTNQDTPPHTATANDGSFDTGTLNKGKSGSHTFTKAGTFPYICSIHPSMKGTVTVAAASGGSSGGGDTGSGASASPDTSTPSPADSGSGLPHTGLNLLAVVLVAGLMSGTGSLLRWRLTTLAQTE